MDIQEFLTSSGYKKWNTEKDADGFNDQYQKRIFPEKYGDYKVCYCNDKLFINIEYFLMNSKVISTGMRVGKLA